MSIRRWGSVLIIALSTVLVFGEGLAQATQYRMSGTWLQRRSEVYIPLYLIPLGAANGPVLGLGDPHVPGSGFVNVTKAGSGPATITVPSNVFHLETSRAVPLQAALSNLLGPGNGGNVIQVTTHILADGPAAAAVLRQSATSIRLAPNFAYCPGAANNPACATPLVGGNDGTKPGIVRYTAGINRFGGTMQMLLGGVSGDAAISLGGSPLRIRHDGLGNGQGSQEIGGPYGITGSDVLAGGDITTGATFTSMGLIGMAGNITGMGTPDTNINTGFPFTTGRVQVQVPGGVSTMDAPTTVTMTGEDNRTANGRGTITMVAGGLGHRLTSGQSFASFDVITLDIASSTLTPVLSPTGFVALGSMLAIGGGFVLRRRF